MQQMAHATRKLFEMDEEQKRGTKSSPLLLQYLMMMVAVIRR